eukprot:TRINITY_DN12277_c0_g1_i3.p1 TRINITY_DN12277_c0_g1~~TRINITY_DN12277_c0_g1_i3.p1  ORF type:complete len:122 (-),score=5.69 TRINITY_DN12277_c0_g1_i3:158-523(-)
MDQKLFASSVNIQGSKGMELSKDGMRLEPQESSQRVSGTVIPERVINLGAAPNEQILDGAGSRRFDSLPTDQETSSPEVQQLLAKISALETRVQELEKENLKLKTENESILSFVTVTRPME